jgi:hypothetical protein
VLPLAARRGFFSRLDASISNPVFRLRGDCRVLSQGVAHQPRVCAARLGVKNRLMPLELAASVMSALALARSAQSPECLAPIERRPIRASVATVSFKLVRTHYSIGWLFLFDAGIPPKSYNSLLFSAVCSSPCISMHIIMLLGVMLMLCNDQCPKLFKVYYIRALCAVTAGASAKALNSS